MPRYVTRAWCDMDNYYERPADARIQVDVRAPQDTGLVDAHGRPLLRLPDRIGFLK